jgi:hypothetical protein
MHNRWQMTEDYKRAQRKKEIEEKRKRLEEYREKSRRVCGGISSSSFYPYLCFF